MREFRIGDLFDIKTPERKFNANTVKISDSKGAAYPYVVRTSLNNGIRGFIEGEKRFLNPGNTFSFGQDTATVFWQPESYFTGDKIKVFVPKEDIVEEQAIYLMTAIRKTFSNFQWGNSSFNESVLMNQLVYLPVTSSGEPDWDFMRRYIRAVEKLVIKDVVAFKDEFIAKAKQAA